MFKKRKILSIVMCLVFVLSFFMVSVSGVMAKNDNDSMAGLFKNSACPTGCKDASGAVAPPGESIDNRYVRLQVEIPGVTSKCTYPYKKLENGSIKIVNRDCYYIKSDLPLFIKKIFNFSLGLIAIVAVIVIMLSGLSWVTAAGDAGKIKAAQGKIKKAVLGVVLILSSYLILNIINPELVNLKLSNVHPLAAVQQPDSKWCDSLPKQIKTGFNTVVQVGSAYKTPSNLGDSLKCGTKYDYGYNDNSGKFVKMGQCDGRGDCNKNKGDICAQVGGTAYCLDPRDFCEEYSKRKCDEVDRILVDAGLVGAGCTLNKRGFVWDGLVADKCTYGNILFCADKSNLNGDHVARIHCKNKNNNCIDPPNLATSKQNQIMCKYNLKEVVVGAKTDGQKAIIDLGVGAGVVVSYSSGLKQFGVNNYCEIKKQGNGACDIYNSEEDCKQNACRVNGNNGCVWKMINNNIKCRKNN